MIKKLSLTRLTQFSAMLSLTSMLSARTDYTVVHGLYIRYFHRRSSPAIDISPLEPTTTYAAPSSDHEVLLHRPFQSSKNSSYVEQYHGRNKAEDILQAKTTHKTSISRIKNNIGTGIHYLEIRESRTTRLQIWSITELRLFLRYIVVEYLWHRFCLQLRDMASKGL